MTAEPQPDTRKREQSLRSGMKDILTWAAGLLAFTFHAVASVLAVASVGLVLLPSAMGANSIMRGESTTVYRDTVLEMHGHNYAADECDGFDALSVSAERRVVENKVRARYGMPPKEPTTPYPGREAETRAHFAELGCMPAEPEVVTP